MYHFTAQTDTNTTSSANVVHGPSSKPELGTATSKRKASILQSIKLKVQKVLSEAGKFEKVPVDPFTRKATRPVLPAIIQKPAIVLKPNRKAELIKPKANKARIFQTALSAPIPTATAIKPSATVTAEIDRNNSSSSNESDILKKDLEISDSETEVFNIPVSLSYKEFDQDVPTQNSKISAASSVSSDLPTKQSALPQTNSSASVIKSAKKATKPAAAATPPLLKVLKAYDIEVPPITRPIAYIQPKITDFKQSKSLKTAEERNSVKAIGYKPYKPLIDQIVPTKPVQERLGPKHAPQGGERKLTAKDRHQIRRREKYLKKLDETKIVYAKDT